MDSEVDTSILNSVNIKRFTKSVLEEFGAEIDRRNNAKWEVIFPEEISEELDRQRGTLVFDPAERELGAGDLLVQPGTKVFSSLLNLVQSPGTIGHLELTEDSLQVNPPAVLQDSPLEVEVSDFKRRTSGSALAFHFRVQFETPSSFHNEEMFSVTVDPKTQITLPDLTARLTSHLPQLLQGNHEHTSQEFSEDKIENAYELAQQTVIERSRPIVSELRDEANESANERIDEISDWYEQRRNELDQQLQEQREEIRKWQEKRRNARKDSTRRRYIKNRKEAEQKLAELQDEVQERKRELNIEESEEIDEIIKRNQVDVNLSLLGVTEVSYARGRLVLGLASNHTKTDISVTYFPATDQFRGLDCTVCSRDLTEGILPRLCVNGHLSGDPCSTRCRSCSLTYCDDCEGAEQFTECMVCREDICQHCVQNCTSCGSTVCADHVGSCSACDCVTCHLCGEDCSSGGSFHCDTHLSYCNDCGNLHCDEHTLPCAFCGSTRCTTDIDECLECGDLLCSNHSKVCDTCGEALCEDHLEVCALCSREQTGEERVFCFQHSVTCSIGEEIVCPDHRASRTIGTGHVCDEHRDSCESCRIGYSKTVLTDGQCTACRSLGEVPDKSIPEAVESEFRSVRAGRNEAYMVILGKKLLGRNKIVVYDEQAGKEVTRHSAGMLNQLRGMYG